MMKNRFFGFIALILGIGVLFASFSGEQMEIQALLGGVMFTVIGSWQLITGKTMASVKDFIMKGKIAEYDKENDKKD